MADWLPLTFDWPLLTLEWPLLASDPFNVRLTDPCDLSRPGTRMGGAVAEKYVGSVVDELPSKSAGPHPPGVTVWNTTGSSMPKGRKWSSQVLLSSPAEGWHDFNAKTEVNMFAWDEMLAICLSKNMHTISIPLFASIKDRKILIVKTKYLRTQTIRCY